MDLKSLYGYRFDSPYISNPYLDIKTDQGLIDMSQTPMDLIGVDNLGNVKKMKAGRKNPYKFEGNIVREIPIRQDGGLLSKQLNRMKQYISGNTGDIHDRVPHPVITPPSEEIKKVRKDKMYNKLIKSGYTKKEARGLSNNTKLLETAQDRINEMEDEEYRIKMHPDYNPSIPVKDQKNLLYDNSLRARVLRGRNILLSSGNPITNTVTSLVTQPATSASNLMFDAENQYIEPGVGRGILNLGMDVISSSPTLLSKLKFKNFFSKGSKIGVDELGNYTLKNGNKYYTLSEPNEGVNLKFYKNSPDSYGLTSRRLAQKRLQDMEDLTISPKWLKDSDWKYFSNEMKDIMKSEGYNPLDEKSVEAFRSMFLKDLGNRFYDNTKPISFGDVVSNAFNPVRNNKIGGAINKNLPKYKNNPYQKGGMTKAQWWNFIFDNPDKEETKQENIPTPPSEEEVKNDDESILEQTLDLERQRKQLEDERLYYEAMGIALSDFDINRNISKNSNINTTPIIQSGNPFVATNTNNLYETAQEYQGTPYKFKGVDKSGIDCSGYVCKVVGLPRTSSEEILKNSLNFRLFDGNPYDFQEGTVVGFDTGPTSFDKGRKYGMDHVGVIIKNPNTGKLEYTHSAGSTGVKNMSIPEMLRKYKNARIYLGDYGKKTK